jgi:hypothetical protein
MLKFISPSRGREADHVANAEAVEAFWRSLPSDDPIASQRAICDALAQIDGRRGPEINRLRALFALDRRSQRMLEGLLSDYVTSGSLSPARERELRHAVFELSRSFAHGYEFFLRYVREKNPGSAWLQHTPAILVQLFKHREVELLLALYRYESWPRGRWKELHTAYEFALSKNLARLPVAIDRREGKTVRTITPEQAFIRVLLLQLMDSGQFVPAEVAVARQWIARWSELPALAPVDTGGSAPMSPDGFVVDLSGSEGMKRPRSISAIAGRYFRLDTTPITASIERELAVVRRAASEGGSAAIVRTRRLQLLSKLNITFAAKHELIKRRGERTEVALMSVQAMVGGLPSIFRMLRDESRRLAALSNSPLPYVDEITITDFRGHVGVRKATVAAASQDSLSAFPATATFGVPQPAWQVRDRSESGCRLRGRVSNPRRLVPGSLMAFREDENAPWTLAVVRRLKKMVGDNIELGVEHIGRNPQRVLMVVPRAGDGAEAKTDQCVALYLPESDAYPRIPIKTLVLPASEYSPGRVFTMLSTMNEAAIRLKEPIENQREFVWTSFDSVEPGRR